MPTNAIYFQLPNNDIKRNQKEKVDFLAKQAETPEATGTTASDLENNIQLTMVFPTNISPIMMFI